MIRKELYTLIVQDLLLASYPQINDGDLIYEFIELDSLENILSLLNANIPLNLSHIQYLIEGMLRNIEEWDDDISAFSSFSPNIEAYSTHKHEHTFILSEPHLSVVSCKFLWMDKYDEIMPIVEKICFSVTSREKFINLLIGPAPINEYYIVYDSTKYPNVNLKKLYHYALLLYLNSGNKIERNPQLDYSNTTNVSPLYTQSVPYEQYLDIYDVLCELNHCKDILMAFIKMYQILEYIIYRWELVEIVEGTTVKQSFLRQIKGVDKKFTNSERDTFIKGLFKILSTFQGEIQNTDITPDIVAFCEKYYDRSSKGNAYLNTTLCNDEKALNIGIAKFIYDTRCAIVHNKEAEFHITYFTYDEYKCIVPLMNKILTGIKFRVIELLNDPNNKIIFPTKHLELY